MITDLHLLVLHFPIALLSSAVAFDYLYFFTKQEGLNQASWWTMFFGVISSVVTIGTGFISDTLYEHLFEPGPLLQNHGAMQIIASLLFIFLFYVKTYRKEHVLNHNIIYLGFSGIVVLIFFYGAHLGAVLSGRA